MNFEDIKEEDEVYFSTIRYKDVCLGKALHMLSHKSVEVSEDLWLVNYKGDVFTVSKSQFKGIKDEDKNTNSDSNVCDTKVRENNLDK